MNIITQRREFCEALIVAVLDRMLEAHAFNGEMLAISQYDLCGRNLLRDGRLPVEVVDFAIEALDVGTVIVAHAHNLLRDGTVPGELVDAVTRALDIGALIVANIVRKPEAR